VTNHTERRGRAPVRAFVHSFIHSFIQLVSLAASSDEEGGKMRRATVSHTDAAAAVDCDVLLRYGEQCEQATGTMSSRCVPLNVLL